MDWHLMHVVLDFVIWIVLWWVVLEVWGLRNLYGKLLAWMGMTIRVQRGIAWLVQPNYWWRYMRCRRWHQQTIIVIVVNMIAHMIQFRRVTTTITTTEWRIRVFLQLRQSHLYDIVIIINKVPLSNVITLNNINIIITP